MLQLLIDRPIILFSVASLFLAFSNGLIVYNKGSKSPIGPTLRFVGFITFGFNITACVLAIINSTTQYLHLTIPEIAAGLIFVGLVTGSLIVFAKLILIGFSPRS